MNGKKPGMIVTLASSKGSRNSENVSPGAQKKLAPVPLQVHEHAARAHPGGQGEGQRGEEQRQGCMEGEVPKHRAEHATCVQQML